MKWMEKSRNSIVDRWYYVRVIMIMESILIEIEDEKDEKRE